MHANVGKPDNREVQGRSRQGLKIGKNVVIMVLSFVGNYVASFATFPYLTRVLGPTQFGTLAYGMAVATYGSLFVEWGFALSGPATVATCSHDRRALNAAVWSIVSAKACLLVMSVIALIGLLMLNRHDGTTCLVIVLSWLNVVGGVFTMYWLFQGLERFTLVAAMIFANRAFTLPLIFLFVHTPGDVAVAAAIQASGPLVAALLSVVIAWRLQIVGRPDVCWSAIMARIKGGTDMFVATASVSLFGVANSVILKSFSGTYEVGLYAAADRIRIVCSIVSSQLCSVLYPRVSRLYVDSRLKAARLTLVGVLLTLATSIASAGLCTLFAPELVRYLMGSGFHDATSSVRLLCYSTLAGNVAYLLGLLILVPTGGVRYRSGILLTAGCLNVFLTLCYAPSRGASGAAGAFLVCELFILVAYLVAIVCNSHCREYLLRPLVEFKRSIRGMSDA